MGHLYAIFLTFACIAATTLWADDSAVINDSGSTNSAGFKIVVQQSGKADYSSRSTTKSVTVPDDLLHRFYADLDAAKPLSALPSKHCMKSASFGTTRTIEYAGQQSPDLSCRGTNNAQLQALIRDVDAIVKLF